MPKYYVDLPSLKVIYLGSRPKIFEHAEWQYSGDFVIICQHLIKSIIPFKDIESIEYPYVPKS